MDSGLLGILGFFLIVVGLPVYVGYRLKLAEIRAKQTADPNADLLARIAALEKKCETLQEQVTEAHILIHDEQRELDRKLAARLEAAGPIPHSNPISQPRRSNSPAEVKIP
ncbi:MAG TPA: hypothetical protein VKX17_05510 [Planctomycetota bacterium]|nr:hypothetical protein [Planctomycetota bacterium]